MSTLSYEKSVDIDIPSQFDPSLGNNYLLLGKRETGKCTVAIDIHQKLLQKDPNPLTVVYTSRDARVPVFEKITGNIYDDLSNFPTVLTNIKTGSYDNKIIIFDQIIFMDEFSKSAPFVDLIINGRCWGCTVIIIEQASFLFPPNLRANVDHVFFFKEHNLHELRSRYHYAEKFMSFEEFRKNHKNNTQNYHVLIANLGYDSQHAITTYKAIIHKDPHKCTRELPQPDQKQS